MNCFLSSGLMICCAVSLSSMAPTAAAESTASARGAIQSRTEQWLAGLKSNNNNTLEKVLRSTLAPGFAFRWGNSKTAPGDASVRAFISFEKQRMVEIYGKAVNSTPKGTAKQDIISLVINGNQATEDVGFAYLRQMTDKQGHPLPSTGKTPGGGTFAVNQVASFHETDHLTWVKTNDGWKIRSFGNVAMTGVL